LGALGAYWIIREIEAGGFRNVDYFQAGVLLFALIPMYWLAVIFHEIGHLVAGCLGGMKPEMLFAGPLQVTFSNSRPRFGINRTLSVWKGLAVFTPSNGNTGVSRLGWMIAGGPTTGLLGCLIGFEVWISLGGTYGLFAAAFSVFSAILSVGELLPAHADGFSTDGLQLLQIIRGLKEPVARLRLGAVVREDATGIRPRDWSVARLGEVLPEVADPSIRMGAFLVLAVSEQDSGDGAAAETAFELLARGLHEGGLESYPVAFRDDLILPIVIFIAERFSDAEVAEKWLAICRGGVRNAVLVPCARAMIAQARGEKQAADNFAAEAMTIISKSPSTGSVMMYLEKLENLRAAR
jgi:hypothetical protein